jgi:hypothetical protein
VQVVIRIGSCKVLLHPPIIDWDDDNHQTIVVEQGPQGLERGHWEGYVFQAVMGYDS